MFRSLILVAAVLVLQGCSQPVPDKTDACGGCEVGRQCEQGVCVCAPLPRPCRPDCEPDDATCQRGTVDATDCTCEPLGQTNELLSISVTPDPLLLNVGQSGVLSAAGTFSSGAEIDITSSVDWTSSDPTLVTVGSSGVVTAVAPGSVRITATSGTVSGEAGVIVDSGAPKELRGLWVTRWNYQTASDVQRVIGQAADAGFNTVFFQVRGRADAFYSSALEPWGAELTGTLGEDPGFDPLAVALQTGSERGVEIHAWLNTVPVWSGSTAPPESTPRHVLLDHPEWLMADESGTPMSLGSSGYLCLSPGIPAARDHVIAVVDDIVSGYDVDGIHLDYIRYYGSQYSHDPVSEQRYGEASAVDPSLTWEDWQRDQVTEIVRRAYVSSQARAGVRLTTAVWHNNDFDVAGSRGYRDYYQDSHAWTEEGIVDAIIPMNYFRLDSSPPFGALADDHLAHAFDRHVYMGVHVLGRSSESDPSGAEMVRNIEYARSAGSDGVVLFAYSYLQDNALWDLLATGPFAESAEVPPVTWR